MKRLLCASLLFASALGFAVTTCTFSDNYVDCTDGISCSISDSRYFSCGNGVFCTLSAPYLDCNNGNSCSIDGDYWSCTRASCTMSGNYLDCTDTTPFSTSR